ncbi:MAG: aldehyde dehydrogenase family protein, partial [Hyphomicrobiales bacterium]|nr:aldehyde dehydrogenase family protein [Hyphomicrobiales bacterium]
QAAYADGAIQERYNRAAQAVAWAIMEPSRNAELAEMAVATTGLGNVADKIQKNHRKTLGLMRDIASVKTCGIIEENPDLGITKIARPIGVVGAVVPSTNPVATPANNVINALKCGNAIILSPSPKGIEVCMRLLDCIHAEFDKIGANRDLVQMIPPPGTKARTQRLLETADLVIVTGSQDNVRRAYSSGTPAIGVGAGNATVIVDETADIRDAAQKIAASKTFDNATSCSSENAVIVVDDVYDAFVAALSEFGGATVSPALESQIIERLWPNGKLNRNALAKDADVLIDALQLHDHVPAGTRFIAVPTEGVGEEHPLSGEKLSLVLAIFRASDFESAKHLAGRLLVHQGAGHSVGLHTSRDARAVGLGRDLPTCRVIVNQAHCFATGGSFNNGLPFSLSMGCGSWGGNSIDENLHWKHFLNITKVVRETAVREPALDEIFEDYWSEAGK